MGYDNSDENYRNDNIMALFKDSRFLSNKQEWETPPELFAKLDNEFHFTLDLAADEHNTKCKTYYSEKDDALICEWEGVCWLNPPYGSKNYRLINWIKKAFDETQKDNCLVVMLIPARTNTKWWHQYCMQAAEVRFICGRPKFSNAKHGLPQPLALIIFKKHLDQTKFLSYYL